MSSAFPREVVVERATRHPGVLEDRVERHRDALAVGQLAGAAQ